MIRNKNNLIPVEYRGKDYPTLRALHREHAATGLSYAGFVARYHRDSTTLYNMLNDPVNTGKARKKSKDPDRHTEIKKMSIRDPFLYLKSKGLLSGASYEGCIEAQS